ncbi:MAG: glycosyltransferase [Deltaproteobacteria bacterium]|jgi:3-deoxy-D-manno-octulosonic-acid transferase|nr:glycosyltransferase [Deltaproteobacteria bacterium]
MSKIIFAFLTYLALPFFCVYAQFKPNLRKSFSERLGLGNWKSLPQADNYIWIHGASVGEINGLAEVFEKFNELPQLAKYKRIITTTTLTAWQTVRDKKYAYFNSLLPLDAPAIVKTVITRIQPKLFIATETELWPNLFFALKKNNIPIILINARISDYSFPKYLKFKKILRPVLDCLDLVLAQTALDAERLEQIGITQAKIHIVGSTKYDKKILPAVDKENLGLAPTAPTLIAGSIRPQEDELIIKAYQQVLNKGFQELQLIIAPRHLEDCPAVAEKLKSAGLDFKLRSEMNSNAHDSLEGKATQVLLLDTLGELSQLYSAADIAFIGGSLVNIGGHNPLEAAAYCKPVIMGQYNSNVHEVVSDLKKVGGIFEVHNEEELVRVIMKLLNAKNVYKSVATTAFSVWQKHQGATARVIEHILHYEL